MNYKLIMTEGQDELAFIEVLIQKNLLAFSREELLMEDIFHKRQIDGELVGYIQTLQIGDTVDIYRVGDKLSDRLKIPQSIMTEKINNRLKVCTLPEFEILFILNEGLYDEYLKAKTNEKPSIFYRKINPHYKKQSIFVKQYFSAMSNQAIIDLIDLYVRKRSKVTKVTS